jgi:hypothetical protein
MPRYLTRITPLIVLLLGACSHLLEPPVREQEHPLQTDHLEYEVRRSDGEVSVAIPFTYRNETGRTVYVVNCQRIAPPALEKYIDGEWVRAWTAVVPLCLSPPIVIRPGATYADTLRVFAGKPASDVYPQFTVPEVEGIYRLVWGSVVHDYNDRRQGFGEPLPLAERISNPFLLKD